MTEAVGNTTGRRRVMHSPPAFLFRDLGITNDIWYYVIRPARSPVIRITARSPAGRYYVIRWIHGITYRKAGVS